MKKYTYIFFFFIFHAVFAQEYSANRYPLHFNQFTESIYLNNSSINGMYQQNPTPMIGAQSPMDMGVMAANEALGGNGSFGMF